MNMRRIGMAVVAAGLCGLCGICGMAAPAVTGAGEKALAADRGDNLGALASLAAQALAADPAAGAGDIRAAVARLRRAGPPAVEAVLAAQRERPAPERRFRDLLDQVCAQRGCAASRLFWYTDLEGAKAEARRTGRPILSLRLLGRLDEDLSCANSRFFRTVLYADPEVSRALRERFVLHWSSERPVPKVTIDFGDGRALKGTLTGNSIHYVLDSRGRLIDGLPGLYGPGAFLRLLATAGREAERLAALPDRRFAVEAALFHQRALRRIEAALSSDLAAFGMQRKLAELPAPKVPAGATPTAYQAAPNAASKSAGETVTLSAISVAGRQQELEGIDWEPVVELHREDWGLRPASLAELRRLHGTGDEGQLDRVARGFEKLVGLDTVRNEYVLHAVLHRWLSLAEGRVPNLAGFNDKVYDELFLTPRADPWLGLSSPETFMALAPEVRTGR
jgi:hypothetical protein